MKKISGIFAVRAIFVGLYLTIVTAFAGVAGNAVGKLAPGLGSLVFVLFFGIGLFAIVILNADLATGNMMFGSYSATIGQISWGKAVWFVFITIVFKLIGCFAVAWLLSQSAKFATMDNHHLIATLTEGKLNKRASGGIR